MQEEIDPEVGQSEIVAMRKEIHRMELMFDQLRKKQQDGYWRVYEPRWPKSADGKYYWKSDTSSDELDGHYFFYPRYYDLVAETEKEKSTVREIVRANIDHLISHDFSMHDHAGKRSK